MSKIPDNSGRLDDDPESTAFFIDLPPGLQGQRLDRALVELLPDYTRGVIQGWIRDGHILLDDKVVKPSDKVRGRQRLAVTIPPAREQDWQVEDAPVAVIFSDPHLLVVNKPAGLVVHPGAGNLDGTLLNRLLFLDPHLRELPRAGIVHRLDKDTSGLMVVARTELARQSLIEQLKDHSVRRRYLAVVNGLPVTGETIDQPIGRHRYDRLRMAVTERGKPAITYTRVVEKFRAHTLLEANLETGRTHQIRVHLSWRGYPLVGDPVYGGKPRLPGAARPELVEMLGAFRRQALHAESLSLTHPAGQQTMQWQCNMPDDMRGLVNALADDRESAKDA